MSYKEFIANLSNDENFKKITEFLVSLAGKKILYFSHDDPDGISSAAIMSELFEYLKIDYRLEFPSAFALRKEDIPEGNYEAIIITDKGTLSEYDKYFSEKVKFLTIDHHFTPAVPEKVMWYNPSLKPNSYCSASYICHNIATAMGLRDDILDFYAMAGLKGDWAIDPAIDSVSDYVRPLYDEFAANHPEYVKKRTDLPPTMFEASQKEHSTLLSRYTHDLHAISGGAFQFFYNDKDPSLKDIFQPRLAFEMLIGLRKAKQPLKKFKSEKDLLNIKGHKDHAMKILKCFEDDWLRGLDLLSTAVEAGRIEDTRVFLYAGIEMNLMPMLGSVALFDLAEGGDAILIMAAKIGYGVHFSVRATGGVVHSGKLCGTLAEKLRSTVTDDKKQFISGGGHPKAAECNVKIADYSYVNALNEFLSMAKEMLSGFDKAKYGV